MCLAESINFEVDEVGTGLCGTVTSLTPLLGRTSSLRLVQAEVSTQKTCRIGSGSLLVYGHYGQRAARIGPDSICRIRLAGSDFPHPLQLRFYKEGMDHILQNRPGSDLDGLVRVWPNTSGLEASRCTGIMGPGFWQDATGPLPVSHFPTLFRFSTDVPDNIVQNQPGADLVLADCVRFWPNGSGPEASQCVQESSGPLLDKASQPIRIGYELDPACLLGP